MSLRRYSVYLAFHDGWAQVPDGWAQIIDDWAQARSCPPLAMPLDSHMPASIWLKLGKRIGGLNANDTIKFGINPINIQGVTSDFKH